MIQRHHHSTTTYSVVIPMKDEEENVRDLIDELEPVMESLEGEWELICIDDGSSDGTLAALEELCEKKSYLRVIVFPRNFGQSSAFDAGFHAAKGEFVITLDGDCQNDPNDIPKLVAKMGHCDLICGIRAKRQDSWFKRFLSQLANKVRGRLTGDGMQDTGCSLKVYRRVCLEKIKLYNGMHRFLPALFKIEGFRTHQMPVNHRARRCGASKYNILNRSLNTISDLLAVIWMRRRHLGYVVDRELP